MASSLSNIYGNSKAQPTSAPAQPAVGGGQASSLAHIFTGSPAATHSFSDLNQTLDAQAAPKVTKAPVISVPKQQPTNFLDSIRQQVESIFKPQPAEKPLPQVKAKAGLVDIGTSPTAATSAQRPLTKTVVNQQQQSVKSAQPFIDTVNKGKAAINTASKTVSKTANQVSDMGLGELKKNQQLYQATKAVLTDFYNNFTFSPVENALVRTGALDKAPKNVFTNLASQEIQQKQAFGKGILQGVARETLNWNDKVKSVLDTQVKNTPKEFKNATTIGGIVGQLATYIAPSGVFQGAKFAKLVLPLTFATLGQTSLPSEESGGPTGTQRIQKAVIDLTAGSMLHMLNQPSYLFSLQSAGLKSAELATLTGQVYADARAQGATHEQATAMVKDALIFNGGLIGALALIKGVPLVGEALVRSRVKEGAGEFTPTEVKNIVINSELEKTQLGKDMLKNALIADAQGKNVKVTMGASKPSVVGKALGVNKESSLGYTIELTDKKDEYFSLPAEERLKTAEEEFNQKAGISETPTKTPEEELKAAQSQIRVKENYSTPLEKTSTEELHSEPIKARDQYLQKHDNIINPDLARQLRPEYKGTNAFELNNYGVGLAKLSYNHLLDTRQNFGNKTVLWTGGGPGSGKSTALNELPQDERKKFVAIVDTTLSPNSSVKDIGKVLKRGYKAEILYTLTDPFEAWKRVIDRALNPQSVDHNRVVNEEYFIKAHNEARKNALEAFDKFKGNPDFKEVFLQDGKEIPVDTVRNFSYNASDLRRQIYEYTDKLKTAGKISGDLYKGFTTQRVEPNGSEGSTESQGKSTEKSPITPEQSPTFSRTEEQYRQAYDAVKEAINSGDLEGAKALRNDFLQYDKIKLPELGDMIGEITDQQSTIVNEAIKEIEEAKLGNNPDHPTNKLLAIAKQIRSNILLLASHKERLLQTQYGNYLLGGKATEVYDRLIDSTDITGFARNIKILHVSLDKVFSEIHNTIKDGGIDGADYEKFKQQIGEYREAASGGKAAKTTSGTKVSKHTETKPTESPTSRVPDKNSSEQSKPKDAATGDKTPSKSEVGQKFDYQSTQLDLPTDEAKKATTFANSIPEDELAKDESDNYKAAQTGRENEPHITVLYGLDNKLTKEQLEKALVDTPPITIEFGKTSLFHQPDKDVLKVDIQSQQLHDLNEKLQQEFETPGQTFSEYKPHMTLAYLKKGEGAKYVDDTTFEGDKITLNHLTFSTNTGEMVKIPLKGAAPVVESDKEAVAQEEPLRPATNAAVGEFASLPNKTESTGTDQPYEPTEDGNPTIVPFPEMVRLAKALTGAYPKIKEKMAAGVRGRTTEGSMDIRLLARLFKDGEYEQAAKTLSHEIGHVADMLPEGFVTKGNILAKIANIKGYLKTLLKEFPSSEDNILTPEDRANIRKAAEKYAKTPVVETVQEVIGKEPVKPQELLAIWNDITAAYKDPELLSYIQGLTSEQKVDLARNAMKGKVPKWVDFMRSVKETVTKEVLRNSKADIRQVYQKMLKDEILARRLHDLNAIKQQLYKLSKEWRPYIEREADPAFIAYRKSSNELYADAISVLLNDPQRLKTSAPDFWRAFFNYLGEKPEVKKEFFSAWDFLRRSDDEVQDARLNDLYEGFAEAKAKREAIELKKPVRPTFIQSFMQQYVSRFDPIYRKLKDATTEAGAQFSPLSMVRMQLEEMQMRRNSSYVYLTNILKDVIKPIEDMGLTAEDLGVLMTLERNLGDRKSIANPYGLQGKFSVDALAFLKKKLGEEKGITEDQFSILEQAARKFREYHFEQILKAGESGLYSQKFLNETAIPNKDTYVTYQVVDYIHKNFVSQAIKHAIGTLNQIENPVVSTILKTISIIEATERQMGVRTTADALREAFPEEYLPAEAMRPKGVFTGWKPAENLVPLEYRDDGKLAAINVDPMIARAFDMKTPQEAHEALRVFSNFNRIFRDVVTTYNLSWGSYSNPLRDASRTYRNLSVLAGTIGNKKGLNIFELPTELAKALPTSIKFQRGQLDAVSRAMLESKAYSTSFVDYDPRASEDTSLAPMLRQYRILPPIEQQHALLHKLLTPIDTLLKGVRLVGGTIETNTKVAGFQILRKRDISLKEAGFYTRNYVGTPNVMEGGTLKHISNQIFIFSNILAQDIRSNLELATGPKTRSGYWFLTFLMDVLPALAALAVGAGLAGQQLKAMQDKISEYNMTNFSNIPLGELSNGHTVYWRIPHSDFGRFVHAIVWKVGEAMTQQGTKPQTLPQALASGILPNTTPLMTLANGWLNYIQGNNPYDSFRGRLVVDDTTWKAGGWPAFQKMLAWTSNTAGLSNFQAAPSYNGDLPQEPWLREIPGLNRAIQTSDYGLQEKEQAVTNKVVQQAAQATLDRKAKLQQFSTEAKKTNDPAQRDAIQKQFIQSVLGNGPYDRAQKAQRTRLKTEFDVAVTKGAISTQMDGLINAQTSAAKTALLQEYKKTMSPDEYKSLVVSAKKGKVISPVLQKKLRKQGLY